MSGAGRPGSRHELEGWGRAPRSAADVVAATDEAAVVDAIRDRSPRGVLGRGLGRAYGDAALNAGGAVVTARSDRPAVHVDAATGVATIAAGASLDQVMRTVLPLGWFVPVTPGTRQVTLGGAVAADIHGKNHHGSGSIGNHVRALRLVNGLGEVEQLSPTAQPARFWATIGGMGLTGIVTEVELQLVPVATSRVLVDTTRATDIDDLFALMESTEAGHEHSVAWVDLVTTGRALGRGVVTVGNHAPVAALPPAQHDPVLALAFGPKPARRVSFPVPGAFISPRLFRLANEAWFRKAPAHREAEVQEISTFFHPLDGVDQWNRVYGRAGFVQWQPVVPLDAVEVMRSIVVQIAESGVLSTLAVLKRMGPANPAPLSFPAPGWTLAADFPVGDPALGPLLDHLDEQVAGAGGRLYLAKDSRLRPELLPVMYPRLDEWRAAAAAIDPDHAFQSDLGRRLGLRP